MTSDKIELLSGSFLKYFQSKGYSELSLPIIYPANYYLETSGENIRNKIILFKDIKGEQRCLRPDLTIPVCDYYLKNKVTKNFKAVCKGYIFKNSENPKINNSFQTFQVGVENIGNQNIVKTDAEIISLALNSVKRFTDAKLNLVIGNVGLFNSFIDKLKIPSRWKERFKRHFWREQYFNLLLNRLKDKGKRVDKSNKFDTIQTNRSFGGLEITEGVAGRSVEEITSRFELKRKFAEKFVNSKEISQYIKQYLAINAPVNKAMTRLTSLCKEMNINFNKEIDSLEKLVTQVNKEEFKTTPKFFSTSFGREIEYYTGMVFELYSTSGNKKRIIAGGGRYDNLLKNLGSKNSIPAAGFAIKTSQLII